MGVNVHACVGGTVVREDIKKLKSGHVHLVVGTPGRILDMMKKGFWLNIISIILIIVITYYLLPYFWDFDPSSFPQEFKKV